MKMKLRHVLGAPNRGIWKGKDMDRKVQVCGAPDNLGHRCDEPYWMGPHTWHSAQGGWWQWCTCGNDHHYAAECEAVRELHRSPEWAAWIAEQVPADTRPEES